MILLVPLVERYLHRANLLHAPDAIAVETTAVRVGLTEADHLALGIVTAVRVQPPSAHLPAISKRHAFAVGRAAATRLRVLHDEAGGAPARPPPRHQTATAPPSLWGAPPPLDSACSTTKRAVPRLGSWADTSMFCTRSRDQSPRRSVQC